MRLTKLPFTLLLPLAAMMFSTCSQVPASFAKTGSLTLHSKDAVTAFPMTGDVSTVCSLSISRARFSMRDVRIKNTGEVALNERKIDENIKASIKAKKK